MTPTGLMTPHDYRGLIEAVPGLTVVGGQAVNLWAITYCSPEDQLPEHGSVDLDVVANAEVSKAIQNLPDWDFKKTPIWSLDIRAAELKRKGGDGRILAVEVLKSVKGLDSEDLSFTVDLVSGGTLFKVLDPVAMLKAKAANVRELKQDGTPPRQDRQHLQIVALCLPRFLLDAHSQSEPDETRHGEYFELLRRTFDTLFDAKNVKTLLACGIKPSTLVPNLEGSKIVKARAAYINQLPRLKDCEAKAAKEAKQ